MRCLALGSSLADPISAVWGLALESLVVVIGDRPGKLKKSLTSSPSPRYGYELIIVYLSRSTS